jgi:hypothetical protein
MRCHVFGQAVLRKRLLFLDRLLLRTKTQRGFRKVCKHSKTSPFSEDLKEDVGSYWMTLSKGGSSGSHYVESWLWTCRKTDS